MTILSLNKTTDLTAFCEGSSGWYLNIKFKYRFFLLSFAVDEGTGMRGRISLKKNIRFLTTAAVIAALYAALTYAFAFMSYGPVQFRVAEILTVLPFFTPAAIPGLAIGCLLSNIASPLGPIDIIVGTSATLIAALLSRKMPKFLVPFPPIVCNAVIVGLELHFLTNAPLLPTMLYVALGEAVVCLIGGYPFMYAVNRFKDRLFPKI